MANKSLMHFNGTDGAVVYTDDGTAGYAWTNNDAQIDTAEQKFGVSSAHIDGTEYIVSEEVTELGPDSWSIDFWFKRDTSFSIFTTLDFLTFSSEINGIALFIALVPGNPDLVWAIDSGGTSDPGEDPYDIYSSGTIPLAEANDGNWHHIALQFNHTTEQYSLYFDGEIIDQVDSPTRVTVSDGIFTWGSGRLLSFTGWIDEARITDEAPYPPTSNFTPLDQEYGFEPADGGEVILPLITLEAEGFSEGFGTAVVTLPLKNTLAGITTDIFGTANVQLPIFGMTAAGVVGTSGNFAGQLPLFTLLAYGNVYIDWTLPLFTLNASGVVGAVANINWLLPGLSLTASGVGAPAGSQVGNANNVLPLLQLLSAVLAVETGSANLTLPMLRLVARGSLSNLGIANLTLPLFTMDGLGWPVGLGVAIGSMILPMFELVAQGYHAHHASYHPWVLNMRKGALSQYEHFNFNSFAKFNDMVLAADENGIHVLGEQGTDNDAEIAALLRTGNSNYEVSYVKRVPRIYTSYKSDGDLEFRVITTHGGTRAYLLPGNGNTLHQQRRVPIGRGPKSAYWQFEVVNRGGSDFSIDNMIVYPEVTKRRVF